MSGEYLENRTCDEIHVGDSALDGGTRS